MLFFLLAGLVCSATANSMLIKHDSIWMLDIDAIGNHEKYVVDFHPVEKRISLNYLIHIDRRLKSQISSNNNPFSIRV